MQQKLENNSDARIIIDVKDSERSYVRDDFSPVENEYESEPESILVEENDEAEAPDETPQEELPEDIPEAVG